MVTEAYKVVSETLSGRYRSVLVWNPQLMLRYSIGARTKCVPGSPGVCCFRDLGVAISFAKGCMLYFTIETGVLPSEDFSVLKVKGYGEPLEPKTLCYLDPFSQRDLSIDWNPNWRRRDWLGMNMPDEARLSLTPGGTVTFSSVIPIDVYASYYGWTGGGTW